MKVLLIAWVLFMILYIRIEKRWDKKRAYNTYVGRVNKINEIRKRHYTEAGILDKYKPLNIKDERG